MLRTNRFSCVIIGETTITVQCAEILLKKGHQVLGMISPSLSIKNWCSTHRIPYSKNLNEFFLTQGDEAFDFLFSIVNGEILSKDILKRPRYCAINYHNSPLPKYAGLYATTWAILNGEKQHAISWHVMAEQIDAGDILKQPFFPIEDNESALSLNLKCYEQAIQSFHQLVDELASQNTTPAQQDLSIRSYYGLKDKPTNFGFISWNQSAECIDRLCRALTFGNYTNQLEVPKVIINNEILVVKSHQLLDTISGKQPGTVVHKTNNGLQITTGSYDFLILELTDCTGNHYAIDRLQNPLNPANDWVLNSVGKEFLQELALHPAKKPKTERYWVNEWQACAQEKISFLSQLKPVEDIKYFTTINEEATEIPRTLLAKLERFSNDDGSLQTLLLTAVLVYLYRLNNYKTLSIGFNDGNSSRFYPFFAAYLPLSTPFKDEMTFNDALTVISDKRTKLATHSTFQNDIFIRYPELTNALDAVEVSITFAEPTERLALPTQSKLNVVLLNKGTRINFITNTSSQQQTDTTLFVNNLSKHFLTLLADVVNHPERQIFELNLIDSDEKNNLLATWNDTTRFYDIHKPLHAYFEEQVAKSPERIAAVFENSAITYNELNQKANQLAHYLRVNQVKPNQLIGIALNRSLEMVICILGILKSGAAYLPLDPNYPTERISFMLTDSQANLLIMDNTSRKKKPLGYKGTIIDIHEVLNENTLSNQNPLSLSQPSDLAYVIYTSGTTGQPKGVAIPHRAVCNHMVWMQNEYAFQLTDVFLQKTPFSFDASVWEFFIPLFIGATLVIAPNDAHASPAQMIRLIIDNKVSVLQLVPSMLKELVSKSDFAHCQSLKHVFCGGEALLPETIDCFFKQNRSCAALHNLYGPTEATIDATSKTCTPKDAHRTISQIGKPIMNTKLYVLDDKLQLVPVGITGELYIAGEGLARGYLNNPNFTKQKFIPNPFSTNKDDKLYKTGDLVKWNAEGIIEYHGRCDNQVKIRGFRIEINEIESHLEKISAIHQCIINPERNPDDSLSLSAYLVVENESQLSAAALRMELKTKMPDYMIPSRFFVVNEFYTTPSGKVNRKQLPPYRPLQTDKSYLAPQNDTEKALQAIWCAVLKIDAIGVSDDFFELGGNSLSAMNIIALIQDHFSIHLSLRTVFDYPTITTLAQAIDASQHKIPRQDSTSGKSTCIVPLNSGGENTPLFLVHPIGGSIFWYKLLGSYLEGQRPLYGIQDPGLDHNKFIFETLEEMASFYIESIQTIQPNGPYFIGGASFGSTVAIEIARQLEEQGETVHSILSLDGWALYPSLQNDKSNFQNLMSEQNSRLLETYIDNNVNHSNFLLELQWHRENMLMNYKMPVITSPLMLFKAKQLTELFQYDAPLNWWENYASLPIELHMVSGDHETMFSEPHIGKLAELLSQRLTVKNIEYHRSNQLPNDSLSDLL